MQILGNSSLTVEKSDHSKILATIELDSGDKAYVNDTDSYFHNYFYLSLRSPAYKVGDLFVLFIFYTFSAEFQPVHSIGSLLAEQRMAGIMSLL